MVFHLRGGQAHKDHKETQRFFFWLLSDNILAASLCCQEINTD